MKKRLATVLRRWAHRLDPQKPRPLYGDVHVHVSEDAHRFVGLYGDAIRSARDAGRA